MDRAWCKGGLGALMVGGRTANSWRVGDEGRGEQVRLECSADIATWPASQVPFWQYLGLSREHPSLTHNFKCIFFSISK